MREAFRLLIRKVNEAVMGEEAGTDSYVAALRQAIAYGSYLVLMRHLAMDSGQALGVYLPATNERSLCK